MRGWVEGWSGAEAGRRAAGPAWGRGHGSNTTLAGGTHPREPAGSGTPAAPLPNPSSPNSVSPRAHVVPPPPAPALVPRVSPSCHPHPLLARLLSLLPACLSPAGPGAACGGPLFPAGEAGQRGPRVGVDSRILWAAPHVRSAAWGSNRGCNLRCGGPVGADSAVHEPGCRPAARTHARLHSPCLLLPLLPARCMQRQRCAKEVLAADQAGRQRQRRHGADGCGGACCTGGAGPPPGGPDQPAEVGGCQLAGCMLPMRVHRAGGSVYRGGPVERPLALILSCMDCLIACVL